MREIEFKNTKEKVVLKFFDRTSDIFNDLEGKKCFFICDANVLSAHPAVTTWLDESKAIKILLDHPEAQKNLESYKKIIEALKANSFTRKDYLIGLGGGATTDLAGFVAATYMRGMRFIQIPTSLLGQVDASVGGKTAINFDGIKNFVGSFYNPEQIFINTEFLSSLNEQEFLNGLAEVIKHAIISSEESLNGIFNEKSAIVAKEPETLSKIIDNSIAVKESIVSEDFNEAGKRKFLNFGHTFAHGIEYANRKQPILHGHAVVIGMLMASTYSEHKGMLDAVDLEKIKKVIGSFNYNFSNINLDVETIVEGMKSDKKNQSEKIALILLQGIGNPVLHEEGNIENLTNFIRDFIENFEK